MNRYTLAVLVRNQFGVLNRLTSMFRRRQFNISSITASETESGEYSRITFSFDYVGEAVQSAEQKPVIIEKPKREEPKVEQLTLF